jgi:hypothetical protein
MRARFRASTLVRSRITPVTPRGSEIAHQRTSDLGSDRRPDLDGADVAPRDRSTGEGSLREAESEAHHHDGGDAE